jgi:hypothetical protein
MIQIIKIKFIMQQNNLQYNGVNHKIIKKQYIKNLEKVYFKNILNLRKDK